MSEHLCHDGHCMIDHDGHMCHAAACGPEVSKLREQLAAAEARIRGDKEALTVLKLRIVELEAKCEVGVLYAGGSGGAAHCAYCHGHGACPKCWGRAGIERLYTERDAALARAEQAELTAKLAFKAQGNADDSAARLSDAYELLEARAEKSEALLVESRRTEGRMRWELEKAVARAEKAEAALLVCAEVIEWASTPGYPLRPFTATTWAKLEAAAKTARAALAAPATTEAPVPIPGLPY